MYRLNFVTSIILVILIPLMIVILSSNLVLRTSATYTYHFNDSQVMNKVPYSITSSRMADEVASYWSSFSSDEFQVYEENGEFRDPVFIDDEQRVMGKAKTFINIALGAGLLCLAFSILIFVYLWRKGYRKALRNRCQVGIGLAVICVIAHVALFLNKGFRLWLYATLIGVNIEKDATIVTILGDPFYMTYLIFSSIVAVVILALITYVAMKLTKPSRIFY